MRTMQGHDLVALTGEHSSRLMVAALGQNQLRGSWINDTQLGGLTGIFLSRQNQGAARKNRNERVGQRVVHRRAVDLWYLVLGGGEAVNQSGLVREQEQSTRLLIQTPDTGDLRIALQPTLGEEAVDIGAFTFLVRADQAKRLVQQEEKAFRMIERFTVDAYGLGRRSDPRVIGNFPVHRETVGLDPGAGFAARAVAEVGQPLIQSTHESWGNRFYRPAAKETRKKGIVFPASLVVFGMMIRGLIFVLAFGLCAAASLTCFKAPSLPAWRLAILVDEFGHWFWALPVLLGAAAWAYSTSGDRGWRIVTVGLCLGSLVFLLKPSVQAGRLARELPKQLTLEFGAVKLERAPFSVATLFLGRGERAPVRRETRVFTPTEVGRESELSLDFYYAQARGPAPCVLVIHGGGWDSGDRGQFTAFNEYLARCGFAVAAIDYRLAPRFPWPAQRDDTHAAWAYLRAHGAELGLDPTRFVLLGRSAGGQIAEAVAYDRPPEFIRGVVALYAPADLYFAWKYTRENDLLNSFLLMRQYLGGAPETAGENFTAASSYLHVHSGTVPTLLAHGQLDALVWHRQSERLTARLKEVKSPVVFLDLPWATHAFDYNPTGPSGQLSSFAIEWFLRAVTGPEVQVNR